MSDKQEWMTVTWPGHWQHTTVCRPVASGAVDSGLFQGEPHQKPIKGNSCVFVARCSALVSNIDWLTCISNLQRLGSPHSISRLREAALPRTAVEEAHHTYIMHIKHWRLLLLQINEKLHAKPQVFFHIYNNSYVSAVRD